MGEYFWTFWIRKDTFNTNTRKKINKVKVYDAKNIDNESVAEVEGVDCLIIDNYKNNIEKNIFYSLLNQSKQLEKYILINSIEPLNLMKNNLQI